MYRLPRGTSDILPREQLYWHHVKQHAYDICRLYGYERIDSPTFEETGLFTRSVGQGTDITEKEMYTFTDKGKKKITLRPEGTAPVCRAYLEHGMNNLPQPVKLYYIASIFRYERPQAGRLRQHHQFGYEAISDDDPALDAEVIDMAWQFFRSLNLSHLSLQLNSIGCKQCRPNYLTALKKHYANQTGELCADCKVRIERNPLRLLDCKDPQCQKIAGTTPRITEHLCPQCAIHFNRLKGYLEMLGIPFEANHRLVRGLDYYTRTVFEIQSEASGAQSTLGGGGRYDDLIEELGGKPTPAIGFATGIERIILNLKKQDIIVPDLPQPRVFIAHMDNVAKEAAIKLASRLRRAGIGVLMASRGKSLKAQLRQANTLGMRQALIIGDEELKSDTATLRDMQNSRQQNVPFDKLPEFLRKMAL